LGPGLGGGAATLGATGPSHSPAGVAANDLQPPHPAPCLARSPAMHNSSGAATHTARLARLLALGAPRPDDATFQVPHFGPGAPVGLAHPGGPGTDVLPSGGEPGRWRGRDDIEDPHAPFESRGVGVLAVDGGDHPVPAPGHGPPCRCPRCTKGADLRSRHWSC